MAIMEKRVLLGVQKTKVPFRRSKKIAKKRHFLAKVVHYLKSDYYLFAPLITSRSLNNNVEFKEENKEDGNHFVKKVGDYLKSDSYMYSSLVDVPPKVSEPRAPQIKMVTRAEVRRKLVSPKAKTSFAGLIKDSPSRVQKETVKHTIHRKYHPVELRKL